MTVTHTCLKSTRGDMVSFYPTLVRLQLENKTAMMRAYILLC